MDELKTVYKRVPEEQLIYELNITQNKQRGILKSVHCADLHFGCINPEDEYNILKDQMLNKLEAIDFDIFCIDGDLLDHKFMSNSDPVLYASLFVSDCINLCKRKNATMMIIAGTWFHDAGQLKLFYHYLKDPDIDLRIIEKVQFEYVKGAKILCIPELYDQGREYYANFLFNQGFYDEVFMHGTIRGAIYGTDNKDTNSKSSPVFTIDDFLFCLGPIYSGHVHTPGCFYKYFYYCGSPIRYCFGEEEEKGFLISLHNLDTHYHYTHMEPVKSFRYDTIDANELITRDPQEVIEYLNNLQSNGIDNIRLDLSKMLSQEELNKLTILKQYYRTNGNVKIKYDHRKEEANSKAREELETTYDEYGYILDKSLSPEEIFTIYVNQQEGYEFITVDELKELLSDI